MDNNERIWIAGDAAGIHVSDPLGASTPALVAQEFEGFAPSLIHAIYQDADGRVWLCGRSGFLALSGNDFRPIRGVQDVVGAPIWALLQDNDRNYWFGTSKGVYAMDYESVNAWLEGDVDVLSPRRFTSFDGLENESVVGYDHSSFRRLGFRWIGGAIFGSPILGIED